MCKWSKKYDTVPNKRHTYVESENGVKLNVTTDESEHLNNSEVEVW